MKAHEAYKLVLKYEFIKEYLPYYFQLIEEEAKKGNLYMSMQIPTNLNNRNILLECLRESGYVIGIGPNGDHVNVSWEPPF